MSNRLLRLFAAAAAIAAALVLGTGSASGSAETDSTSDANAEALVAVGAQMNALLALENAPIRVDTLEAFTIGSGRMLHVRLRQQDRRWVPNDPRRGRGDGLTYMVDPSFVQPYGAVTAQQAIQVFRETPGVWKSEARCLANVPISDTPYQGYDPSYDDWLLGYGAQDPFGPTLLQADIIYAGFYPGSFFDSFHVPGGISAFAATFYFVDPTGVPTDINNDQFLDSAQSEIYFNASMGDPTHPLYGGYRSWGLHDSPTTLDLATIALHETGHSLGLSHFADPPRAVMNPRYLGELHDLQPIDQAGICTLFGSWPQR